MLWGCALGEEPNCPLYKASMSGLLKGTWEKEYRLSLDISFSRELFTGAGNNAESSHSLKREVWNETFFLEKRAPQGTASSAMLYSGDTFGKLWLV